MVLVAACLTLFALNSHTVGQSVCVTTFRRRQRTYLCTSASWALRLRTTAEYNIISFGWYHRHRRKVNQVREIFTIIL